MNYWLLLIPLLTAFSGWLVIRLILILLFRPLSPKKIAGFTWQGLIPRQKQQIAIKLGKFAESEFSAFADVEQKISDPKNFDNIRPLIENHIDDFLRNKLKEQMPMISMFIGDKTINSLKVIFIQEIETLFPQVMQQFAGNLKKDINIREIVSSKIAALPAENLDELLHRQLGREFQAAHVLGATVGLLIGIIQLLIMVFVF